jgi:transposase
MRRTTLSDAQRAALQHARHDPSLRPYQRDRVEMILLSASGWSPPKIAAYLGWTAKPVRAVLDRYRAAGLAALQRQRPGPPPDTARHEQVTGQLRDLLAEPRTWSAGQLASALRERDIQLSKRQTRRYLHRLDARWRRTQRSLRHKQNPKRVATAKQTLAALKKGRQRASSASPTSMNAALAPASR